MLPGVVWCQSWLRIHRADSGLVPEQDWENLSMLCLPCASSRQQEGTEHGPRFLVALCSNLAYGSPPMCFTKVLGSGIGHFWPPLAEGDMILGFVSVSCQWCYLPWVRCPRTPVILWQTAISSSAKSGWRVWGLIFPVPGMLGHCSSQQAWPLKKSLKVSHMLPSTYDVPLSLHVQNSGEWPKRICANWLGGRNHIY